jgi:hypothetical protein
MTNINIELFKRYAPTKKLEIINGLNEKELMAITQSTIIKTIRESGRNIYKSRDKELVIASERRAGNDWNSKIEDVTLFKGSKLLLNAYVQMDDTDTNLSVTWEDFYKEGNYRGTVYETNRYGDKVPHYFTYGKEEKAKVIKSILLEDVYTKYKDKLK